MSRGNDFTIEREMLERKARQCLVVLIRLDFEMADATTRCTTICSLLKTASLVTAGWEALRTMYPHFDGVDSLREKSAETASSTVVEGLGKCRMGNLSELPSEPS